MSFWNQFLVSSWDLNKQTDFNHKDLVLSFKHWIKVKKKVNTINERSDSVWSSKHWIPAPTGSTTTTWLLDLDPPEQSVDHLPHSTMQSMHAGEKWKLCVFDSTMQYTKSCEKLKCQKLNCSTSNIEKCCFCC